MNTAGITVVEAGVQSIRHLDRRCQTSYTHWLNVIRLDGKKRTDCRGKHKKVDIVRFYRSGGG